MASRSLDHDVRRSRNVVRRAREGGHPRFAWCERAWCELAGSTPRRTPPTDSCEHRARIVACMTPHQTVQHTRQRGTTAHHSVSADLARRPGSERTDQWLPERFSMDSVESSESHLQTVAGCNGLGGRTALGRKVILTCKNPTSPQSTATSRDEIDGSRREGTRIVVVETYR